MVGHAQRRHHGPAPLGHPVNLGLLDEKLLHHGAGCDGRGQGQHALPADARKHDVAFHAAPPFFASLTASRHSRRAMITDSPRCSISFLTISAFVADVFRVCVQHVKMLRIYANPEYDPFQLGLRQNGRLGPGHGHGRVVGDDEGHVGPGRDRVHQGCHARVQKCAVADHRHHRMEAGLGGSLGHPDRRSHAHAGLDRRVRRQRA